MDNVSQFVLVLIVGELIVALLLSYGLHRHIYREERDVDKANQRLSQESPIIAKVVKALYGLILIEFIFVLLYKLSGR